MYEEIFVKGTQPRKNLLDYLIAVRSHHFEKCQMTTWLNQPISLQAHHIDGDRTNNELNNLELLCLNCHSLTDNFGSKNKKRKETISDEEFIQALQTHYSIRQALLSLGLSDASGNYKRANKLIAENNIIMPNKKQEDIKLCQNCGKRIENDATYCFECYHLFTRKVENRPDREELKNLIRTVPFTKIGEKYGVSDNAIRKWCIVEKLP